MVGTEGCRAFKLSKKHFTNQSQTNCTVATFNFTGMDENKKNQQVKQLILLLLSNVRGEIQFQRIEHLLKGEI